MVRGPFTVPVSDLLRRPGLHRHERLQGELGFLRVVGTAVTDEARADVDVDLESIPEGIVATGTVSATWEADCRRCLRPMTGTTKAEFRELFSRHHEDEETYPIRHEEIDFEALAREAVLLELPLAPLCEEQCRGMCPMCGADLNERQCECPPPERDHRWAALDQLRVDAD